MEKLFIDRVKKAKLTKGQMEIADYFIRYPERVGISSSMDVAKAIGVSDASITRFARAIGYEGFTDLKNDIYRNLADHASGKKSSLSLAERIDLNQANYDENSLRYEYIQTLTHNLERTFQRNSEELFDQVVTMLIEAEHRYIVGFRGCLGVAGQCAWLLRLLLDHIISILDEGPGGVGSMQDIREGDCVLLFSLSRYYKTDLKLAQLAKQRKANLCIVTNSPVSPLAELADVMLLAETEHLSFFNSTSSLTMISEYIITKIAQILPDDYRNRAIERDKLTRDLRL